MGRIDSTSSAQLRSGSPSECPGFATSFVIDGADRRPADEREGRYGEHPPGKASMPPGTGHGMVSPLTRASRPGGHRRRCSRFGIEFNSQA
jgi:hypothetical protein